MKNGYRFIGNFRAEHDDGQDPEARRKAAQHHAGYHDLVRWARGVAAARGEERVHQRADRDETSAAIAA